MLILDNKFENVKSAKFVLNILTSDLKKNRQDHKISYIWITSFSKRICCLCSVWLLTCRWPPAHHNIFNQLSAHLQSYKWGLKRGGRKFLKISQCASVSSFNDIILHPGVVWRLSCWLPCDLEVPSLTILTSNRSFGALCPWHFCLPRDFVVFLFPDTFRIQWLPLPYARSFGAPCPWHFCLPRDFVVFRF